MKNNIRITQNNGFSLLELVLALFIITVILLCGYRFVDSAISGHRINVALEQAKVLSSALVGDPNVIQSGHQAMMGYYEVNVSTTAVEGSTGQIVNLRQFLLQPLVVIQTATPSADFTFQVDPWNKYWNFQRVGLGPPPDPAGIRWRLSSINASAPRFTRDIQYEIRRYLYRENNVRIYIKDAQGTILRGNSDMGDGKYYHQIYTIRLDRYGEPFSGTKKSYDYAPDHTGPGTGDLIYDDGAIISDVNIWAGAYKMLVRPVAGGGVGDGFFSHVYLTGDNGSNGESWVEKVVTVYPLGTDITQIFEVRLPGIVDPEKLRVDTMSGEEPMNID